MNLKILESRHKYSLKDFTTIKIGGEARNFFVAETLGDLQKIVNETGSSFYLLGRGSNLLVKDTYLDKTVLKLGKGFSYIREDSDLLEVGASTLLSSFIDYAVKNNLGGIENLAGIPATLGGLIAMNASSFGRQISDILSEVEIMDKQAALKRLKKEDIKFSYRASSLKGTIILRAWFKLYREKGLKSKAANFLRQKMQKQDFSYPSCGCVFKNPDNFAAGFLIDACGLKGLSKNGAKVSNKHANFILNTGNATYNDVDYLISQVRGKVYQKFSILLEEEIERWG